MNEKLDRLRQKKLFLFDIDGTIAVGDTLYKGTAALLRHIESIGGRAFYITNNSTRSGREPVYLGKPTPQLRTEERRVGKEGRSRWSP